VAPDDHPDRHARRSPAPLPTFRTAWITPAGMVKALPALNVLGGWLSI
jgi:hypothetical protein